MAERSFFSTSRLKEVGCGRNALELHSGLEYLRDREKDETPLNKNAFVHITRPIVMTMVMDAIAVTTYLLTHITLKLKTQGRCMEKLRPQHDQAMTPLIHHKI